MVKQIGRTGGQDRKHRSNRRLSLEALENRQMMNVGPGLPQFPVVTADIHTAPLVASIVAGGSPSSVAHSAALQSTSRPRVTAPVGVQMASISVVSPVRQLQMPEVLESRANLATRASSGSTTTLQDGHTFVASYTYSSTGKLSVNTSVTVPGLRFWDQITSVVYVYSPQGKLVYTGPQNCVQYGPGISASTKSWSVYSGCLQLAPGSTIKVGYTYNYIGVLWNGNPRGGAAWATMKLS